MRPGSDFFTVLLSRKYKISIDTPCHESWDKMQVSSQGRFCDACAKNVTDFSAMTEQEIAAYFRNRPANVCGRFRSDQLQKDYVSRPQIRIPFHKRFFGYLISFFVSNTVVNKAVAQTDTVQSVQKDSLQEMAAGHTVIPDSLALAADTTSADSLLKFSWDPGTESHPLEIKVDSIYQVTMISGGIGYAPPEEKSFIDLCKIKIQDSLTKYFKAAIAVKQNDFPVPKKEPVKKQEGELTAVLPEELRRKNPISASKS